jgi:hypothetical protein
LSYLWCQVWFAYGPAQWWCDKPRLKHVWTWSNSQTLSGCLFVLFKCLGCGGQAFFYLELNWVFCVSFLCPVPSSLTCSPRCRLGLSDFTSLPCFFPPKNTLFWGAAVIIIVKSQTLLAKIALRWWNFGANFLWTPKLQGHHRLLGPGVERPDIFSLLAAAVPVWCRVAQWRGLGAQLHRSSPLSIFFPKVILC